MVRMTEEMYRFLFRTEAFTGNCLFNNLSRLAPQNQSFINNQNNNCKQQHNNVVTAGVAFGGTP
jgi:hypothetical protein